jgi:hypothetical protein
MCMDARDWHDRLSPSVAKIQLLCRLSPIIEDDEDYIRTMHVIIDMIGDYAAMLRRDLDGLMVAGGAQ